MFQTRKYHHGITDRPALTFSHVCILLNFNTTLFHCPSKSTEYNKTIERIHQNVPDPGAVEERYPWKTVDREVSPSKTDHVADETEHDKTSGARGGERVLDQPAVHDSGAGGGTRS